MIRYVNHVYVNILYMIKFLTIFYTYYKKYLHISLFNQAFFHLNFTSMLSDFYNYKNIIKLNKIIYSIINM